jgi:hypothetical protein
VGDVEVTATYLLRRETATVPAVALFRPGFTIRRR